MILVTGGTGYIGAHTVLELLKDNDQVLLADNFSNSDESVLSRIREISGKEVAFEKVEFSNLQEVQQLKEKYPQIDSVIHFAAFKAVGESVQHPLMYYRNNLISLINLLSVFEDSISNFVFSSSCTVYGNPESSPVSESNPVTKASSPYGSTKLFGEQILMDFAQASDINIVLLRYFNPIGAHSSGKIGEEPVGIPNNLIPYLTQTVNGEREILNVFGGDYDTPDGTCIRDYLHVEDLATAHVKAVEFAGSKMQGGVEVFNLGTGKGYSVLDVIHTFEEVNERKVNYQIVERREGDVVAIFADPKKANEVLGWVAQHDLKDMLRSAWVWELNRSKPNE